MLFFHGGRKQLFEQVISRLREDAVQFEVCPIILKCCKDENIRRAILVLPFSSAARCFFDDIL